MIRRLDLSKRQRQCLKLARTKGIYLVGPNLTPEIPRCIAERLIRAGHLVGHATSTPYLEYRITEKGLVALREKVR